MAAAPEAPVRDAFQKIERWFKAPVLGVASPVAAATAAAAPAGESDFTRLLEKNKGVRVRAQRKGGSAAGAVAEAAASAAAAARESYVTRLLAEDARV